jgi:Gram-negative bacterial TonB protein C-terminal
VQRRSRAPESPSRWIASILPTRLELAVCLGKHAKFIGTPTPPFAMLKEAPEFPADREYRQQMTVASAILQADGKLEQVAVRQSPEPQLAEPLIAAPQHWLFEPAKIDGKPVALKILLGIRLAASHQGFHQHPKLVFSTSSPKASKNRRLLA